MFRSMLAGSFAALVVLGGLAACSVDSTGAPDTASDDLTQGIDFVELDVSKHHAAEGLTVLKSKDEYKAFFGENPPAEVNFQKHWVLHYGTGMRGTGGYAVEVTSVKKTGGATKTLVVDALETAPGPHCSVSKSFTWPDVTVRVNKQPSTPKAKVRASEETVDCGTGTGGGAGCEAAGGVCKSSPIDVTFGADCRADYGMGQIDEACPAVNQTCCVECPQLSPPAPGFCEEGQTLEPIVGDDGCTTGFTCGDACPQLSPPAPGFCAEGQTMRTKTGPNGCVTGFFCVVESDNACTKQTNDACTKDSDCVAGGCGGDLCYNPTVSSGISTCECFSPAVEDEVGCGCVAGKCQWWEAI